MDRVLIVEDDLAISEILQFYLTQEQAYEVVLASSAEEALPLVRKNAFDIILLDIMLPGMDGISFCTQLRKRIYCPIIFISCMDDDATIIKAMNMGGDDYLTKPISCSVLKAYVAANIRRSRMRHVQDEMLTALDLVLDTATRSVTKNKEVLYLSPTEYEILYYMLCRKGEFMSYEDIYSCVWGNDSGGDVRTLFTHVGNLRKKLDDDAKNPRYIITHPNGGYVFVK